MRSANPLAAVGVGAEKLVPSAFSNGSVKQA